MVTEARTSKNRSKLREAERRRFNKWMRKYWGGISRRYYAEIDEYDESAAQTAWEVWKRFTLLPLEKL